MPEYLILGALLYGFCGFAYVFGGTVEVQWMCVVINPWG